MSPIRVRLLRDTPASGEFDWLAAGGAGAQRWRIGDAPLAAECIAVVPSELVTLQSVPVPPAQADRIGASLRYLVEDRLASEPERTHVASVRTAKDRLCVAAIDREWLQGALGRLRQAGVTPRAAYPECLLPPCPAETWIVVCAAGEAFARTGPWTGLALGPPVGAGEPPEALRIAVRDDKPRRLLLRATPEGAAADVRAWSGILGIPVQAGPAWDWTRDWEPALDLLQGEFAPRTTRRNGARLRRVAFLASAVIVLFSSGIALEWFVKARQRAELTSEMARLHRETFGDRVPVVDPPAQMRQAVAELRRQSGQAMPGDFIALLSRAFGGAAEPAARVHQIAYDGTTLAILVHPADVKRIATPAERPELEITTEPAEWGGQPAVRVKLRSREARWTASR
ncbi:MAG TPA: type II secretion system protein GspL [Burkholderiales bacterium]|nr:type II secretion system protein GspL [Burkholderiales bacterium]